MIYPFQGRVYEPVDDEADHEERELKDEEGDHVSYSVGGYGLDAGKVSTSFQNVDGIVDIPTPQRMRTWPVEWLAGECPGASRN